ncbi:UNKNOWN [Stylonychia lemnae]|uniref:Transmembrane protein n=1 Tax=Stylonychia lemnae TaxID=5949 RepID=A0A078AK88_STYLE|nr:UNKNOWN [Stylonychia lemnae]|eukprot:CDW82795.1 UNKNOWN [Stylonychia lemnae]
MNYCFSQSPIILCSDEYLPETTIAKQSMCLMKPSNVELANYGKQYNCDGTPLVLQSGFQSLIKMEVDLQNYFVCYKKFQLLSYEEDLDQDDIEGIQLKISEIYKYQMKDLAVTYFHKDVWEQADLKTVANSYNQNGENLNILDSGVSIFFDHLNDDDVNIVTYPDSSHRFSLIELNDAYVIGIKEQPLDQNQVDLARGYVQFKVLAQIKYSKLFYDKQNLSINLKKQEQLVIVILIAFILMSVLLLIGIFIYCKFIKRNRKTQRQISGQQENLSIPDGTISSNITVSNRQEEIGYSIQEGNNNPNINTQNLDAIVESHRLGNQRENENNGMNEQDLQNFDNPIPRFQIDFNPYDSVRSTSFLKQNLDEIVNEGLRQSPGQITITETLEIDLDDDDDEEAEQQNKKENNYY